VAAKGLDCNVLTDFAQLEKFSPEWMRLHATTGKGEIFQHFAWIHAWWHTLRKDSRLFTPIVFREGRVVAILPLVLTERRLRFLGYSASDYNHFLANPVESNAALEICLRSLREHETKWDEILLENVPESSLLAECIRGIPESWQRWIVKTPGEPCPTLVLGEKKREALDSLLAKDKLRKTVRYLGRRGKLNFRHLEGAHDITTHLPQFFRQHIRRSVLAGRPSRFLDGDYVSFYENLLERFGAGPEIRFSVLELEGRAIAYHFGSLFNSKYLYYKPTFDVDLWDQSPGQALLWYLFDYLQAADVEEFDFGKGDDSYKYRFSNHVHQNVNFTIGNPGYRFVVLRAYRHLRDSAKRRVRNSPALDRAVRTARGTWRDLWVSYKRAGLAAALRELFGKVIFDREESWVVSVDASSRSAHGSREVSINETSLGGLADFAIGLPEFLTEDRLLKARDLLRQKKTAWIASIDGSEQSVIWTSVDADFPAPTNSFPLPGKAMLVLEIWPLSHRSVKHGLVPVLRQVAAMAAALGLNTWAVCPKALLPSRFKLSGEGLRPAYRCVRTQILGKAHWKYRPFG
jgi:CelD/BcsL family acetyltransferase involved in cellulose biosynthesis